jgi:ribosomal protein L7/L12
MSYTEQEVYELRQRVDKLERQVARLQDRLGMEDADEPDPWVSPEIVDLVQHGKKIQAIKLYRQQTGAGLKAAKDFIDSLER